MLERCAHAQVSDDAERSVLVKLKTECGYQFTSKLESMFTDIKTSADTMRAYKSKSSGRDLTGSSDIDLSVQVVQQLLTRGPSASPAVLLMMARRVGS